MSPSRIMPDEMSVKSICLDCTNYDRKGGVCSAINPFAQKGDNHFLALREKSACYGYDKASE